VSGWEASPRLPFAVFRGVEVADGSDSLGDDVFGRPQPWPGTRADLDVERIDHATATATVRVRGEIDVANVADLRRRLDETLRADVQTLVVDLSEVSFCDVGALNLLLRIQSRLAARGGRLTVLGPCPPLQIMVGALGLADQLHLVPAQPGRECVLEDGEATG
jgi:anti-anti-sigma factor